MKKLLIATILAASASNAMASDLNSFIANQCAPNAGTEITEISNISVTDIDLEFQDYTIDADIVTSFSSKHGFTLTINQHCRIEVLEDDVDAIFITGR